MPQAGIGNIPTWMASDGRPNRSPLPQQVLNLVADALVIVTLIEVGEELAALQAHRPPKRPGGMTAHQRALIVEQLDEVGDGAFVLPVAGGDAGVTHDALALNPLDRCPPEQRPERLLAGHQDIGQERRNAIQVKGQEGDFVGLVGEALEGADILADIAAEDPVAEVGPQVAVDPSPCSRWCGS